ncbi:RNA polymerase sigma factor [Furfurilactobacillus curtus]|uniref:DNA-directed RNA polymerase sigma-70 factor n=1 Tax=Furfurilactobacillus curtus TaxID=1746200 RepID=A0ABQ5JQH2_9LACO
MVGWDRETEDLVINDADTGDRQAFERLFNQYQPLVVKYYYLLHFKGILVDYDDWQQESRIVLTETLKRYHGRKFGEFGAYFKTNIRNRGFDLKRQQNALKRRATEFSESIDDESQNNLVDQLRAFGLTGSHQLNLQVYLTRLKALLSPLETFVWQGLINGISIAYLAYVGGVDEDRVTNAINRCHIKATRVFRAMQRE